MILPILFFSLTIMTTIVSTSVFSINGNYIRRTFYEMPPDVVSSAVFLVSTNGLYDPHFNKDKLEETIKEYLSISLSNIIDKYQIGFVYIQEKNDKYYIDYSRYPKIVDITFKCVYNKVFNFEGTINFRASGVYNGKWKNNRIYRK